MEELVTEVVNNTLGMCDLSLWIIRKDADYEKIARTTLNIQIHKKSEFSVDCTKIDFKGCDIVIEFDIRNIAIYFNKSTLQQSGRFWRNDAPYDYVIDYFENIYTEMLEAYEMLFKLDKPAKGIEDDDLNTCRLHFNTLRRP